MNHYLFTLAIAVQDRPARWGSVSGNYVLLARTLEKLGHRVTFALHPAIRQRKTFSRFNCVAVASHAELSALLGKGSFSHAFIWGGRLPEDRITRTCLEQHDIKVVFSELGWFPQAGTLYFDAEGTNAEVSFNCRQYPALQPAARRAFSRQRRNFYRRKVGLGWFTSPPAFAIQPADLSKPILVPLQDEGDTNITQASPFKRMADFVDYLAQSYPDCRFVVRPHPSAPVENLPQHANVSYQNSTVDVYRNMQEYGLVMGINSTLLLEAAMMNMPVVAFGQGIGTGTGVFHQVLALNPPASLTALELRSVLAEGYLAFLIGQRQIFKKDLASTRYVRNSYLRTLLDL